MSEINFIADYRSLQPMADEGRIQARQASFNEIEADVRQNHARAVVLVRLAFKLPHPNAAEGDEWFSTFMTNHSPTFSLAHDQEEAAIMATLVLRDRIISGSAKSSLLALAGGFAGRRETVDKGRLIAAAKTGLAQAVRRIGQPTGVGSLGQQNNPDLTKAIAVFDEKAEGATKALVDAQTAAYLLKLNNAIKDANSVIGRLSAVNSRLMDEINMLWWHIGGHSVLADMPLEQLSPASRAFVVAADVAEIIGSPPGPYGAYGIIRKALGPEADKEIKLVDALKALKASAVADTVPNLIEADQALVPVHYAAATALLGSSLVSATQFKKSTGLSIDTKLSLYELALQVFHERLLINDELVQ
ncbi:hypothetical protein Rleg9DRAFT_7303 [Rhizobium leguminosarum bv. trifolii WSM597]|uniref:GTPase-associated system helical domain-containing protein n=1 Tax=Rhizobium leguminosarum bv. trifolii WSM597 TaxID=754764 RepID=J0GXA8_RHILT|nr:GTPase-associated system all-helical protein GASH [Rhizobium leguminosarum]EJB02275.1 hypothetical protein Rleg9DRAFT_1063 [Rhizobium leguminosarum bv. trifolii WSM597]EJB08262.1 hypothetical protein Rleg9DRAFT_7303 [Rhizobium leguminosarum bv. trifolii WSM597]